MPPREFVHVEMVDAELKGVQDLLFALQEWPAEVHRRGVVGVQFAVASEVLKL